MPELLTQAQADFSAGAFPGLEDVPPNGVEDIRDGFLRDDGAIERRGGTAYLSTADAGASGNFASAMFAEYMPAVGEERVGLVVADGTNSTLYILDGSSVPVSIEGLNVAARQRPVKVGGMVLTASTDSVGVAEIDVTAYGGARRDLAYGTGTVTVTNNSTTVTGVGTGFVAAGLAAGDVFTVIGPNYSGVIKSVDSATQLTLLDPWPYPTEAGTLYVASGSVSGEFTNLTPRPGSAPTYLAAAGGRLLVGQADTLWLSTFDDHGNAAYTKFDTDNFHRLPEGTVITGLYALGDLVYIFTNAGIYALSNVAYDITDDAGNAQQTINQVSPDLRLWHDLGLVGWQGQVIVPAIDDLYVMGDGVRPITGGARKLYREYVSAGYRCGQAAIYRGHYFLPIMPSGLGAEPIDVLVWRVDRTGDLGAPFVRWDGHAGQAAAFAVSVGEEDRAPRLLGGAVRRILNLSACLEPAAAVKSDATGTAHQLQVTTRPNMVGETQEHTLRFARLRYELDDAASDNPTFTAEWSRGRAGSAFTALAGSAPEGEDTYTWTLAKSGQQTRMRFTSNGPAARAIVRAVEQKVLPHGRI